VATIIYGKTVCSLCGQTIQTRQDAVGFSAFVSNEMDPLWKFNDAACHTRCLQQDPLGEKAKSRHSELLRQNMPERRICVVCGKKVQQPDDYFTFGYLVDDPLHPLYPYNYAHLHRSCISKWERLREVLGLIEDLKRSGAWKGAGVDWIQRVLTQEGARSHAQ